MRAGLALLGLALASCTPVDSDQARICRVALPALEPPGTRIAIARTAAVPSGVRIDYRAGEPSTRHYATCRFSPANRVDLVGVTTDRGELAGATVYLLKRYYVETADGAAADPGRAAP